MGVCFGDKLIMKKDLGIIAVVDCENIELQDLDLRIVLKDKFKPEQIKFMDVQDVQKVHDGAFGEVLVNTLAPQLVIKLNVLESLNDPATGIKWLFNLDDQFSDSYKSII